MKEQGVLINSEQYFHIPSDFAKNILFYPTMGDGIIALQTMKQRENL